MNSFPSFLPSTGCKGSLSDSSVSYFFALLKLHGASCPWSKLYRKSEKIIYVCLPFLSEKLVCHLQRSKLQAKMNKVFECKYLNKKFSLKLFKVKQSWVGKAIAAHYWVIHRQHKCYSPQLQRVAFLAQAVAFHVLSSWGSWLSPCCINQEFSCHTKLANTKHKKVKLSSLMIWEDNAPCADVLYGNFLPKRTIWDSTHSVLWKKKRTQVEV